MRPNMFWQAGQSLPKSVTKKVHLTNANFKRGYNGEVFIEKLNEDQKNY